MFFNLQKKDFILKSVVLVLVFVFLFSANDCLAQSGVEEIQKGLQETAEGAGIETSANVPEIVGKIIKIVIAFSGLILTVLLIYGGVLWMTSGGNADQVKKAKTMMGNAIIGLVIVILSYAVASFVVEKLAEAVNPQ